MDREHQIEILREAIRRRREAIASSKVEVPAESKRIGAKEVLELRKEQAQTDPGGRHPHTNPFREPDKRYGGGQKPDRKKKKRKK